MSDQKYDSTELAASYGAGYQAGQQLKSAFTGVDMDAVVEGLKDGFVSAELKVSGDKINEAFQEIQQKMQAEQAAQAETLAAEGQAFLEENAKRDGVTVTESGLQYEVLEAGDGETPTSANTVRTHYRGTLINGKQFDSSYDRGQPAEFPVTGVIAGWTEALQLMTVGSKWKLFIPYNLAYGERGAGGDIGPYQALVFEIELLAIV